MKNILLAFLVSFFPLTASSPLLFESAYLQQGSPLRVHGFYFGAELGGHLAEGVQAGQAVGNFNTTTVYTVELQKNVFDHAINGMMFAGYGISWLSFYLAAEGIIQLGTAKLSSMQRALVSGPATTTFNISLHTKPHVRCCQYGLDLLPGWFLSPGTLLFGRIGVGKTHLFFETETINQGTNLPFFISQKLSRHKNHTALRAGAGAEQQLSQRLSLRADYIYSDYGKLFLQGSLEGTSSSTGTPIGLSSSARVHLYDHALMLGLCYHFCRDPFTCIPPCSECAYHGFYLGATLGGAILEARQQGAALVAEPIDTSTLPVNAQSQLFNHQFQGMFFLGYGKSWRRLYLGGELIAAASSHTAMNSKAHASIVEPRVTNVSSAYDTTVKSSTWQYGLDVRPGYLVTSRTLLSGRVGVSAAEIKANSSALGISNAGVAGVLVVPQNTSVHRWKAAYRLGADLEQELSRKVHLRIGYIFTDYGSLSFNKTATALATGSFGPGTLNNTLSSHLRNHAVVLGLSYYFH